MALYSAADIVGKTLIAAQTVPLKRLPFDVSPEVYHVAPGVTVGVVYSYLLPGDGRKNLYWQFLDSNGNPYYAEHIEGRFDVSGLIQQGVRTTLQKIEADQRANETVKDTIERNLKWLVMAAGVIIIGKVFIEKKVK